MRVPYSIMTEDVLFYGYTVSLSQRAVIGWSSPSFTAEERGEAHNIQVGFIKRPDSDERSAYLFLVEHEDGTASNVLHAAPLFLLL